MDFKEIKREWDRNRSFVRIRFRRPTSSQLSRAVKADEISVVEPTQPLSLARQPKDSKRLGHLSQPLAYKKWSRWESNPRPNIC